VLTTVFCGVPLVAWMAAAAPGLLVKVKAAGEVPPIPAAVAVTV